LRGSRIGARGDPGAYLSNTPLRYVPKGRLEGLGYEEIGSIADA
jgi:hypothetical protein